MLSNEWVTTKIIPKRSTVVTVTERENLIDMLAKRFHSIESEWLEFIACIQDEDELWEYENPPEYWDTLCGEAGIVIIRGGVIVGSIATETN